VEPGEGILVWSLESALFTGRSGARVRHASECPVGPHPNRWTDWCVACGEFVPAGRGVYDEGVRHLDGCPPVTVDVPTWRVRRPARKPRFVVGETVRAWIIPRRHDQPVPEGTPGYRVIDDEGMVDVVVTVLETCAGRGGAHLARVRAANWAEAEDILAEEIQLAPDVRPHGSGHKAAWCAEQIGPAPRFGEPNLSRPWLAEITGRDRKFGFKREFVRAKREYAQANSKGTRGIWFYWTLSINRVYEAWRPLSWNRSERLFLRATPEGDVEEISREEVEAWLNVASEWMYSPPHADA
jgi:hypothetical protein